MARDRREFFIQADKRSPLRRFWDQEVVWRANALYHNDALNLPVKIVTGSRMDDEATPGRIASAALAFTPFGRIGRSSKITTLAMNPTAAGIARYFGGYGRNAPTSAEFASKAFSKGSVVKRELSNMAGRVSKAWSKTSIAEKGVIPALAETAAYPMRVNNYVGRSGATVLFGKYGLPSIDARVAAAGADAVAGSGKLRGAANFITSPLGLYLSYRLLKNPSDQAAADDKATADNKAAGDRMSAREQFNKDVIEAVERRSDKVVLNDWLTRKLAAYDDANKNRVKTAFSEAQRSREKGDHSAESAEARTVAALASVDAANLATLMEGVDRESDAWKALRSDREKDIVARSEDQFMDRYGYDYSTGTAMRSGKDPAAAARATKDFTEFLNAVRSAIPTNGVDEIRFMTGGQYGK